MGPAVLALTVAALLSATAAAPTVKFGVPSLVGSSNTTAPNGSNFWFPSISIPTGIKGHVAQHITLSGDGGTCPPKPPLSQFCEQVMLTVDGGSTYSVTKKINAGTSGNFNGYGDLGAWVPAKKGAAPTPGEFQAVTGCNDCSEPGRGGSLKEPIFLHTWMDDGSTLKLTKNVSVTFKSTPEAFTGHCAYGKGTPCGFSTPDQSIIRTPNGDHCSGDGPERDRPSDDFVRQHPRASAHHEATLFVQLPLAGLLAAGDSSRGERAQPRLAGTIRRARWFRLRLRLRLCGCSRNSGGCGFPGIPVEVRPRIHSGSVPCGR